MAIYALKDWNEVGQAINELKEAGLPLHSDPIKSWDLNNIRRFLSRELRCSDASIVDLGCGPGLMGCLTLNLLRTMGYSNLHGIDLYVPLHCRVPPICWGWLRHRQIRPYRLTRGDITCTRLPAMSIDAAVLLSVIEHGVDIRSLLQELNRIVVPGGLVYVSTDYWPDKVTISQSAASGAGGNALLPWKIFSKEELLELIAVAGTFGFEPVNGSLDLVTQSRPASWLGFRYTFAAMELRKSR